MSVEALQFIPAGVGLEQLTVPMGSQQATARSPFVGWLEQEMTALNAQIMSSEADLRSLAAGETTNLHQVMMELEKSKTSFQLAVQVRNKLLEAYQEVMRMQV